MKMRGLMRWLFLCVALAAACDNTTTAGSDFGVELPGCRGPSKCWRTDCPCIFTLLDEQCLECDPDTQAMGVCACDGDAGPNLACIERAQVCVGKATSTCDGLCVRAGQSCMTGAGDPPDEVASTVGADGGPAIEKRCPYLDDICCD